MSTDEIRIRGSNIRVYGPWPLGSFPHEIILGLSRQIVHRLAIGHSDITGDVLIVWECQIRDLERVSDMLCNFMARYIIP